jgi:hypothetical protein
MTGTIDPRHLTDERLETLLRTTPPGTFRRALKREWEHRRRLKERMIARRWDVTQAKVEKA